jgi:hypothetical protein
MEMKSMKCLLLAMIAVLSAGVGGVAVWAETGAPVAKHPLVVRAVAPLRYPPIARQARASSKAVVEVTINSTGKVVTAKMVEGHLLFRKVSEKAAVEWLFVAGADERSPRLIFTFTAGEDETDKISFLPPYEVEFVSSRPEIIQQ